MSKGQTIKYLSRIFPGGLTLLFLFLALARYAPNLLFAVAIGAGAAFLLRYLALSYPESKPGRIIMDFMAKIGIDKNSFLTKASTKEGDIFLPEYNAQAMEEKLGSRIFGQQAAVKEMAHKVLKARARTPVNDSWRGPAGVVFMTGPTGTGKSQLGKLVAEYAYGTRGNLIEIDCARLDGYDAGNRLFGAGAEYQGANVQPILSGPASRLQGTGGVILLNEAEKAHPTIWQNMMEFLDTGWIIHGNTNQKIDGRRFLVLFTTNASPGTFAQILQDKDIADGERQKRLKKTLEGVVGKPEIAGRVRHILVFDYLSDEALGQIVAMQLIEQARDRFGVSLDITKGGRVGEKMFISLFKEACSTKEYGAREVARRVEDLLTEHLADVVFDYREKGEKPTAVSIDIDNTGEVVVEVTASEKEGQAQELNSQTKQ